MELPAAIIIGAAEPRTVGDAGEAMPRTMMIGLSAAAMAATTSLSPETSSQWIHFLKNKNKFL